MFVYAHVSLQECVFVSVLCVSAARVCVCVVRKCLFMRMRCTFLCLCCVYVYAYVLCERVCVVCRVVRYVHASWLGTCVHSVVWTCFSLCCV